jgi:hypothetical protein
MQMWEIMRGVKLKPNRVRLYGKKMTPEKPVGACICFHGGDLALITGIRGINKQENKLRLLMAVVGKPRRTIKNISSNHFNNDF